MTEKTENYFEKEINKVIQDWESTSDADYVLYMIAFGFATALRKVLNPQKYNETEDINFDDMLSNGTVNKIINVIKQIKEEV